MKTAKSSGLPRRPLLRLKDSRDLLVASVSESISFSSTKVYMGRHMEVDSTNVWIHLQGSITTETKRVSNMSSKDKNHRCILRRKSSERQRLNCHVCNWNYSSYARYFEHLMDRSCLRQRNRRVGREEDEEIGEEERPLNLSRLQDISYSFSDLCPHEIFKRSGTHLSIKDNALNEAELGALSVTATRILVDVLGEERLVSLGYPQVDILAILNVVLKATNSCIRRENDGCTKVCSTLPDSIQLHFRVLEERVKCAQINIKTLKELIQTYRTINEAFRIL